MEEGIKIRGFSAGEIGTFFNTKKTYVKILSPLTLAYIGDAVYEIIVRTIVVENGNAPVNKLNRKVSSIVKAVSQKEAMERIESKLSEEELAVYKRGRNAKSYTSAKNASIIDYRIATGLEALVGYLYLDGRNERLFELVKIGLGDKLG